jgi:hypothetical protein
MNDRAKDRVVDPEPIVAMADEYRSPLFEPIGRKWWSDGTPLSKTTLVVAEYADGAHGAVNVDKTDCQRMVLEARSGALVRVHAGGDATGRAILDVFEHARKLSAESISRCQHIAHNFLLRDEDCPRFRRLNVVADVSPVIY